MRVLLPDSTGATTGKGHFFQRLQPAMERLGVTCVHSPKERHDIYLDAVNYRWASKAPRILRLDGIWFAKNRPYRKGNERIRKNIRKSKGVIWQSKFSRDLGHKVLKVHPKLEKVIHNGAHPDEFDVEPAKSEYFNNIIVVAKWIGPRGERPHKRLKQMLKICEELCHRHIDLGVWVCGKHKRTSACEEIRMLGHVPHEKLKAYYKASDIMLNLGHHDSCPNTVVEALVAGVPVISAWGGGIHELVDGYGVVLPLDKPFKPGMIKTDKPPKMEGVEKIYPVVEQLLNNKATVNADHLHIDHIASKYVNFMKKVRDA